MIVDRRTIDGMDTYREHSYTSNRLSNYQEEGLARDCLSTNQSQSRSRNEVSSSEKHTTPSSIIASFELEVLATNSYFLKSLTGRKFTAIHKKMSRPELTGHASSFYNESEARKYHSSSRMVSVQREITLRAIELLRLPPDQMSYILDVGCGSGLSGSVLEEQGHAWVGCDVSRDMLQVAKEKMNETFVSKGETSMKDNNDSDSEEEEDAPSTGDLMHHVSFEKACY